LPSLAELGPDLLRVSAGRKALSLVSPFLLTAAFFYLAHLGLWWAAVPCTMLLSFLTYGSISHDLVHRNLRLPAWLNESMLSAIELLGLRSGHAYRAAHLNHHAHFPDEEDVEGAAAHMSWPRAAWEGVILQPRLWHWSLRRRSPQRELILAEGIAILIFIVASLAALPWTWAPVVYAALMVAGSWIFPIVTVVIPHLAAGTSELTRTRLFRGRVLSWLALDHLYHLEHHLYPQVPHHNWRLLAERLDPAFERAQLKPVRLLF
jgi:beta-carotene hydroxylase